MDGGESEDGACGGNKKPTIINHPILHRKFPTVPILRWMASVID